MKKEKSLQENSTEELEKMLKTSKTISVITNGLVLFIYAFILFRFKRNEMGSVVVFPLTLTIIAVIANNKAKKIKEELKSRGVN